LSLRFMVSELIDFEQELATEYNNPSRKKKKN
jgi:hypothetical protein